jgi:hypothetical protein
LSNKLFSIGQLLVLLIGIVLIVGVATGPTVWEVVALVLYVLWFAVAWFAPETHD